MRPFILKRNGSPVIFEAIWLNRIDIVNLFLEYGLNPNLTNKNNLSLIMKALASNNTDIVNTLLDNGAKLTGRTKDGHNTLMFAAYAGRLDLVTKILDKDFFDINEQTSYGCTVLWIAATDNKPNSLAIFKLLLKKGADPNIQTEGGRTVLMDVIKLRSDSLDATINALIEADNIDLLIQDNNDETALTIARHEGHDDIAEMIEKKLRGSGVDIGQ